MKRLFMLGLIAVVGLLSGCSDSPYDMQEDPLANYSSEIQQSVNSEEYSQIVENPFIRTSDLSVSTFSSDVDTASYTNIRRFLNDSMMPAVDAIRVEEMVNYFDYNFDEPTGDDVFSVITEMHPAPWNAEHDLLMIGLKTEEIDFADSPGNNLVFLLDVSGSMNNADKLPLLKAAMRLLVNELRPEDRISIVVYAGAAGVVLDGADGNDAESIIEAIDSLEAGGSTAGGAGIKLAYKIALEHFIEGGNNRVILGTDGDFNVGVSTESALEKLIEEKRESGVYLSVLGFGSGNLKDNRMESLADTGNGIYYYIDSILEAKKVFVSELGASLVTIAKDVKLQIEFNPSEVKGYRLIGYENRVMSYDDFYDNEKDAGDIGAGHEMVVFYEIIRAGSTEEIDEREFEAVEELKYSDGLLDDLATLKIRYKNPVNDIGEEIEFVISNTSSVLTTTDFNFAACVIEFGLLLRDSEYKGEMTYDDVIALAENNLGLDTHGYRSEFLELVEIAKLLDSRYEEGDTNE